MKKVLSHIYVTIVKPNVEEYHFNQPKLMVEYSNCFHPETLFSKIALQVSSFLPC